MAAYPFQQFPKLEEFCDWFKKDQGGSVEYINTVWGKAILLKIPSTQKYVFIESEMGTLTPSTLKRIETRLDITTPWTF